MSGWEFLTTNTACGLLLIATLLYYFLTRIQHKNKNYPPGPKGYPLVGYLKFITDHPNNVVAKLSKDYKHVFMFPVGYDNIVILNSVEAIKEAYIKNANFMTGIPPTFKESQYLFDFKGIICEEGESWKEQRKFAINVLKEFGVGKSTLEDKILEECDAVINEVRKKEGKPFYAMELLANASANVICAITFGKRFKYDDPLFKELLRISQEADLTFSKNSFLDYFNFLRYLPHRLTGLKETNRLIKEMKDYMYARIAEHENTYNENNLRDYVDYCLKEIYKQQKTGGKGNNVHDVHRLYVNAMTLFVGGSLSTAMFLIWAIKYLITYPEVYNKILEEIDRVIGKERRPSWMDRLNMPYLEAFTYELFRFADILPIGAPHWNTEEIQIMGYDIPKRSTVFYNLHKINRDPQIWEDPENFRLEHFFDVKTGKVINTEHTLTFGIGKRKCFGENLARMEGHLLLASLLQNFNIRSPPSEANGNQLDVTEGIIRYLKPFDICATPRH